MASHSLFDIMYTQRPSSFTFVNRIGLSESTAVPDEAHIYVAHVLVLKVADVLRQGALTEYHQTAEC